MYLNKEIVDDKQSIKAEQKYIFFDFDGVLVDSEPFYFSFWKNELTFFDFRFRIEDLVGKSNEQFLNQFKLSSEIISILIKKKINAEKLFFENEKIHPNLLSYLDENKNRFHFIIVSNNSITSINSFLRNNNCVDYFDLIIHKDLGYLPKPAPDSYLAAIQSLKIDKKQVIVVEDSMIGCEAAHRAGLKYILVDYQKIANSILTNLITFR